MRLWTVRLGRVQTLTSLATARSRFRGFSQQCALLRRGGRSSRCAGSSEATKGSVIGLSDSNPLGQATAFVGKGGKDRPTVLPESLVPRLQHHVLKTVNGVFEEDRSAGRPGDWLAESLARRYQRAGEPWQ